MSNELTEENIEGLIWRTTAGEWVTFFDNNGQSMRAKVDYCPWCGKCLSEEPTGHDH